MLSGSNTGTYIGAIVLILLSIGLVAAILDIPLPVSFYLSATNALEFPDLKDMGVAVVNSILVSVEAKTH
jgi:hypothetical protein